MRLVNGQLGVMGFGTPGIDVTANTNLNLQENQWYLFSVTYDGDSIRFFLNNQLIDTEDVYPEHNTIGQNNYFGKSNHAGWEYYLNGSLDDIAIYNRALTPAEITALYSGVPAENSGDSSTASTHVPAAIAYQAVARDAQGQPLSTSNVQVRFTLLADSLSGASEYVETHALTTNEFGLFTTAFGSGAPVTSTFAAINWAASNKYLKVELDAGSGFVDMGTQQLLSVPFALRSKSAGEIENDSLPVYPDNAAALAGGLTAGKMYRTATGDLKVVY